MSDHIERRVIAPNVDPMRTHLNRELVRMPEGIRERDDAIAARISSAGIRRKSPTTRYAPSVSCSRGHMRT